MSEHESVTVHVVRERTTRNTVVYVEASLTGAPPVMGAPYWLRKEQWVAWGKPDALTLTVRPGVQQ